MMNVSLAEVRRQIERADTPVNGGYGNEYPLPDWNPALAYESWERKQDALKRYKELKSSVAKMAGTSTVEDCVVANFDHDSESDLPPVNQYLDALQDEAFNASVQVWLNGGQAAVEAYAKPQSS